MCTGITRRAASTWPTESADKGALLRRGQGEMAPHICVRLCSWQELHQNRKKNSKYLGP
jgi:hypothetical protein